MSVLLRGQKRTSLNGTPLRQNHLQHGHWQNDGMLRHFVRPLVADHFLDEGEWPLPDDEALLASITTNYLLLPDCTISKQEF
jgi:hypothetical protein